MSLELSGRQIETLRVGLAKAFVGLDQLDMFLTEQTNRPLVNYTGPADPLPVAAFKIIRGARAEGWVDQLVLGAIATRPNNPEFTKVAAELGLTAAGPNLTNARPIDGSGKDAQQVLEDIVRGRPTFINVEAFLTSMSELQSKICRIEVGATAGTGFLIGPDLVMTNFHVMRRVIFSEALSDDVKLRFDFRQTPDGTITRNGTVYRPASNWLVDSSPYSQMDLTEPAIGDPAPSELDYCILRLADPAGAELAGGSSDPNAMKRGWIKASRGSGSGKKNDDIFILQHPSGGPLKLAIGRHLGFNDSGTRMRYDADTLGGSSGSPVFNSDLKLVGLHHRGDPNADEVKMTAEHNQGIPIAKIIALAENRGTEQFWE
jgi:hypothetical protein